jgi:hypothetical protein
MKMNPQDIPLRCRCGQVRGVANQVAPHTGFRFICYCRDCQAFARFLGRSDVLDAAGGTDIFQMPTGRVKLTAGSNAVRGLRLSNRIFRWYSDCCQSPIGNSAGPRFPVVGIIHSFMDHDADGRSRDAALGAPVCRIFERSATSPLPPNAPPPLSIGFFPRRLKTLLHWWVSGLGRPHPFFDEQTGTPISVPRLLTPDERAALDAR